MRNDILALSAAELAKALQNQEISALEACDAYLLQQDAPHAFLTKTESIARDMACRVDAARQRGEQLSSLAGVPVAVKDNICTAGVRTTCASQTLENFVPAYDATAIARLRAVQTPILGKTNMDEFAMGSTGERSAFYATENPHRPGRTPGGSSSGSAAAVAARLAPFALGSDTGGSVRLPAAYCGVVGFKPSYGTVSRFGLIAFASSLDQIGVLARNCEDAALLFEAIAGRDARDMTSTGCKDMAYFTPKIGILAQNESAISGDTVDFPLLDAALPAYYIISSAEAASNLARYDGIRYGHDSRFGEEVQRRIALGNFVLAAERVGEYYDRACRARAQICRAFDRIFEEYDVLVLPTAACPAPKLGEPRAACDTYAIDAYTVLANLAYLPAISLPIGECGVTLLARRGADHALLRTAKEVERGEI